MLAITDKNTKAIGLESSALKSILGYAKILAKGRSKECVTAEDLFLAVAGSKKHNYAFPLDVVEKVMQVINGHGKADLPVDPDITRLLKAVDQIENCPEKQVELLIKWVKKEVLHRSAEQIIESFRSEEISGVRQLSSQGRVICLLQKLGKKLRSKVKGQEQIIDQILKQLAAWMLTPASEKKNPLKLTFSGPPSSGKRLLAASLAEALRLDNGKSMPFMEIDLKGYVSHQNWETLFGFSSGYSSSKEGSLTGFVKENPVSLILFTHIESAHENTISSLSSIFLKGEARDRQDEQAVDFSKSIIIVTTSREMGPESGIDSSITSELLKNQYRFKQLSPVTLFNICRDSLQECRLRSEKRLNITLSGITPSLAWYLAAHQMPDADVRNISDSVDKMLWDTVLDAYMLAVDAGRENIKAIELRAKGIAELDTAAEPGQLAGIWLHRLASARRRLNFNTEIRLEDVDPVIELLDFSEQMVPTPSDRGLVIEGMPEHGFDSLIGHDDAVARLRPITYSLRAGDSGVEPPRGILLDGAPGTGKTAAARAFAAEAGIPFIRVSGSDLLSPMTGGSSSNIRHAFNTSSQYACPNSILFIDEIDSLVKDREAVTELLTCMQGVHDFSRVLVIGTTNHPEELDDALARRFDVKIQFGLPNPAEREAILAFYMHGQKAAKDIRLGMIAKKAIGLSGAFLEDLVKNSRRLAYQRGEEVISEQDLHQALDNILFGESSKKLACTEQEKRTIAVHEAGHSLALISLSPETAQSLAGVSILNRNGIGGAVLREDNSPITHQQEVLNLIAVLFGGIEAERLCLGVQTTGCSSDLQKAAMAAERMVLCFGYGMDGQVTGDGNGYHGYVDESTRRRAAEQVASLLKEQRERCARIIAEQKQVVEILAEQLVCKERLSAEEVFELVQYKEAV